MTCLNNFTWHNIIKFQVGSIADTGIFRLVWRGGPLNGSNSRIAGQSSSLKMAYEIIYTWIEKVTQRISGEGLQH